MMTKYTSSLANIQKALEEKKKKRHEIFNIILKKCSTFIEKNVAFNNYSCFYQVPEFMIGYPLYSLEECVQYIQQELIGNGFYIKYFLPNILYISWNPIETSNPSRNRKTIEHTNININKSEKTNKKFVKSISNYKPSGKFVLNL